MAGQGAAGTGTEQEQHLRVAGVGLPDQELDARVAETDALYSGRLYGWKFGGWRVGQPLCCTGSLLQ